MSDSNGLFMVTSSHRTSIANVHFPSPPEAECEQTINLQACSPPPAHCSFSSRPSHITPPPTAFHHHTTTSALHPPPILLQVALASDTMAEANDHDTDMDEVDTDPSRTRDSFRLPYSSQHDPLPEPHLSAPVSLSPLTPNRLSAAQIPIFAAIANHYKLEGPARQAALYLAETAGDEARHFALSCQLALISQQLSSTQLPQARAPIDDLDAWQPSSELKVFVRKYAQYEIISPTIEGYATTKDSNHQKLSNSFETRVVQHLRGQHESWKERLLPKGFGSSRDAAPATKLIKWVGTQLKHNRDYLRKYLLLSVLPEHNAPPNRAIPHLPDLILYIKNHSHPSGLITNDQILQDTTMLEKLRFAYLRLEAIHYYSNPTANKNLSQWTAIDKRLDVMRGHSPAYLQAFYALVFEKDHLLFGDGTARYSALMANRECVCLPTEAEIEDRASQLDGRFGS